MILAIRALRATIFAFNASICVMIAAFGSETTIDALTEAPCCADGIDAPNVFFTVYVPAVPGAKAVYVAFPPRISTEAAGVDPVIDPPSVEAPANKFA